MTIELGNKGIPLGSYEEGSGGSGATVDCYSKAETDSLLEEKQNEITGLSTQVTSLNEQVTSVNTQIDDIETQIRDIETILDSIGGGAAPVVTFSSSGEIAKAGATATEDTLTFTDLGDVSFDVTGSATLKQ